MKKESLLKNSILAALMMSTAAGVLNVDATAAEIIDKGRGSAIVIVDPDGEAANKNNIPDGINNVGSVILVTSKRNDGGPAPAIVNNTINAGRAVAIGTELNVVSSAPGNGATGDQVVIGVHNTVANGQGQEIAIGTEVKASGKGAISIGYKNEAIGGYNVSIGYKNKAKTNGNGNALSLGSFTEVTGTNSTAVGIFANTSGDWAVASGSYANASGDQGTAMGLSSKAEGTQAVALGAHTQAKQTMSLAVGERALSEAEYASAIGPKSQAKAAQSQAFGYEAVANSEKSLALGAGAVVDPGFEGAVAIGSDSTVKVNTADPSQTQLSIDGVNFGRTAGDQIANPKMVFSIGSPGHERQLQNVAAGAVTASSTDVVNGSQLFGVATKVAELANNKLMKDGVQDIIKGDGIILNDTQATATGNVGDAAVKLSVDKEWVKGQAHQAFAAGKNITIAPKAGTPGVFEIKTADDVDFNTVTVAGPTGVTINTDGIDAKNHYISNVASPITTAPGGDFRAKLNHAQADPGTALNAVNVTDLKNLADSSLDTNFTNLTPVGKTNAKNLINETVKLVNGNNTIVSDTKDADGNVSWKVDVNLNPLETKVDGNTEKIKDLSKILVDKVPTITINENRIQGLETQVGNLEPRVTQNEQDITKKLNTADLHNVVKGNGILLKQDGADVAKSDLATKDVTIELDEAWLHTQIKASYKAGDNVEIVKDPADGKNVIRTKKAVEFDKVTLGPVVIDKNVGINAGSMPITGIGSSVAAQAGGTYRDKIDAAAGTAGDHAVTVADLKGLADESMKLDLSNLSQEGDKKVRNIARKAVVLEDGLNTTVKAIKDETAGAEKTTYKVNVDFTPLETKINNLESNKLDAAKLKAGDNVTIAQEADGSRRVSVNPALTGIQSIAGEAGAPTITLGTDNTVGMGGGMITNVKSAIADQAGTTAIEKVEAANAAGLDKAVVTVGDLGEVAKQLDDAKLNKADLKNIVAGAGITITGGGANNEGNLGNADVTISVDTKAVKEAAQAAFEAGDNITIESKLGADGNPVTDATGNEIKVIKTNPDMENVNSITGEVGTGKITFGKDETDPAAPIKTVDFDGSEITNIKSSIKDQTVTPAGTPAETDLEKLKQAAATEGNHAVTVEDLKTVADAIIDRGSDIHYKDKDGKDRFVASSTGFTFKPDDDNNIKVTTDPNGVIKFGLEDNVNVKDGLTVGAKNGAPGVAITGEKITVPGANGAPGVAITGDSITVPGANGANGVTIKGDKIENIKTASIVNPEDAVNKEYVDREIASIGDMAMDEVRDEMASVGSHSAALAALKPLQYRPEEKTQIMAGFGRYKDHNSFALGLAVHSNEDLLWNGGMAFGRGNSLMVNAGVTWRVGTKPVQNAEGRLMHGPITAIKLINDDLTALQVENASLHTLVEEQNLKIEQQEMENKEQAEQIKELQEQMRSILANMGK